MRTFTHNLIGIGIGVAIFQSTKFSINPLSWDLGQSLLTLVLGAALLQSYNLLMRLMKK